MSTDRYEITDDGTTITIAESSGIRSTIDPVDGQHLDDVVIGAIRQQSADIDQLRARLASPAHAHLDGEHLNGMVDGCLLCQAITERDQLRAELAAAVAERDEWKECAMSNLDERDQLRAQLAEYENAPTVAVVWFARNKDGVACSGLDYTDLPPIGTELIARKVKK